MKDYSAIKSRSITRWIFSGVISSILLIASVLWFSLIQNITERTERSALYARMIEATVTRTLEALEISLLSLSDELEAHEASPDHFNDVRERALNVLNFAPQLRQIVIIKNNKTIVNTNADNSENPINNINLEILGFKKTPSNAYSLGLNIGTTIKGRYLPTTYEYPDESARLELIPIGFSTRTHSGEDLLILAAFNSNYLTRYIKDLDIERNDNVYLIDFHGNALVQTGLFGPNRDSITQHLSTVLESGEDEDVSINSSSYIPTYTTTTRLSTKYPLAIAIVTNFEDAFFLWVKRKSTFLLVIGLAIVTLIIGAIYIVRINKKAFAMRENVHLLSEVVEKNPTAIIITDNTGDIQYVNRSFEQITGYKKNDVLGQTPRILKSGHMPEPQYDDMWQKLKRGKSWYGEFHNRRKNGLLYWERASISPLINDDNEITHFIALKQEITEERKAQNKLRLASAVFNAAAEAILVTDAKNRIQMVNPSFQKITGYSEAEVIGQTPAILKSGKHSPQFYKDIYEQLNSKHKWEGEIWNKRKNGEIYPEWIVISCRLDLDKNIEGYVALFSDITKRKSDEAIILHQANYDALTGLPNRNLFEDRLKQSQKLCQRNKTEAALFFIDLDRFKYVNDTFGHLAGDLLLQLVSTRLESCIRKSDTVARLGGDEFAIIIPEISHTSVVEKIAKKILASLTQPFILEGNQAYISCSIGIVTHSCDATTSEQLIANADSAMYKAKTKGRNRYEFFDKDLSTKNKERNLLENDIYNAIERNEFYLTYQPIWSIDGKHIRSIEALIRWQHPQKGLIPPSHFIPIAEESGQILAIGEWVIKEACKFAQILRKETTHPPSVSVNISSVQFMEGRVAEIIQRELAANNLPGSSLVAEITESVLLSEQEDIYTQLKEIVSVGVDLAIDDFGTGYSSLSYLKKYPIKRLKVDKIFIDEIASDMDDQALVSGILSLAESLSLLTIIEGIETESQLAIIRGLGSPMIQGYLFSKPIKGEQILELLDNKA